MPENDFAATVLSNAIAVGAAGIAFFASALLLRHGRVQPLAGWRLLAIGLGLLLLGEVIWAFQEAILRIEDPFPSVADIAWLSGLAGLLAGLIITWRYLKINLDRAETIAITAISAVIVVATSFFLLIPIITSSEVDFTEKALDVAYPLADILIIIPALALMLTFDRSQCGRSWRLICAGLFLLAVGDFGFSYLSWHNLYWSSLRQPTNFIDLFWVAGYLMIAGGIFYYDKTIGRSS